MNETFYSQGLRFQCLRCSRCCRFDSGYVYVSQQDIRNLSAYLEMSEELFIERYCRSIPGRNGTVLSLKEKPNYDCIFWTESGCQVYDVRPFQCKSYPFWENYLRSQEDWNELEKSCPGVNTGRLYSYEEINHWKDLKKKEIYSFPVIKR